MEKEELQKLVKEHKDSYPQIIKAHHKEFYSLVCNNNRGKTFGEKLYRHIHIGEETGKCCLCKKDTKFKSFQVGFNKYCGTKCSNIDTAGVRAKALKHEIPDSNFWIEKPCEHCGKLFYSLIKRNGRFCSNKCSTKVTANDANRLQKIRKTKLERYGNETFVNPEKAKKTCLKKYGTDNASKTIEVINSIKRTNREKYGADWFFQSKFGKGKIKK